jgi:adenylate cyclase
MILHGLLATKIMIPERKLKIQNILIIIGLGLIFGLLYNFLFYPHTLTEFLEAGSISILIGLFLGILEEFVFKNTFQRMPFLFVSIIRTLLYSIMISIILCLVLSIEISLIEQINYPDAVYQYLKSPLFQRDFLFSFSFIFLILFTLHLIQLIGRANFFRLFLGLYHQPREVHRILMFLDLKGSTSIAEKLTNESYSSFIRDFFNDVSDAIIMYRGEIYQYEGDGVIVIWPIRKSNSNCIRSFFKMVEIIENKRSRYLLRYDVVPRLKAGIHAGPVVVTEVGKQKKEIVYHGDVLNTTSRIEGKCNELKQNLLISEDLLQYVKKEKDFILEEKGAIEMKGKSKKLSLYGVLSATYEV